MEIFIVFFNQTNTKKFNESKTLVKKVNTANLVHVENISQNMSRKLVRRRCCYGQVTHLVLFDNDRNPSKPFSTLPVWFDSCK